MACLSASISGMNIWDDDWGPQPEDWSGGGGRSKRLPRAAERPGLGATLYEDGPVRYLMASTVSSPEVCEYPDLKQVTAQARTPSLIGESACG